MSKLLDGQIKDYAKQDGSQGIKIFRKLFDTVLMNNDTLIEEKELFTAEAKNSLYRNISWPNGDKAYDIYAISMELSLSIKTTSGLGKLAALDSFLKFGKFEIDVEGFSRHEFTLSDLTPFSIIPDFPLAVTEPESRAEKKITTSFLLPEVIKVGGNMKPTFKFIPATGYTTAAAKTECHATLPNSGLTGSNGHFLKFELHATEVKSIMRSDVV